MPTVNLSTLLSSTNFVGYTGSAGVVTGYSGSAGGGGITGNLHVSGATLVSGDIVPTSNNVVNLGSPNARFGTLYISANTIDIGGAQITSTNTGDISFSTTSGNVSLNSNTVSFLSNVSQTGAVTGYTGSAGPTGFVGSQGIPGPIGYTGSASITPAAVSDQTNTSTGYFSVPSGTTAQRPASPAPGMVRYNTTIGGFELYSSLGWVTIGALEVISVTPTTYNGESGTSFSISGVGFVAGSVVKFVTNDNTEYTAGSVTYISSSALTATTPQDFTIAQEPLSVKIINPGGLSVILSNIIDCGGVPSWTTAAGSLGTFYDSGTVLSINLIATDPDAGATITYSLASGSLPPGSSLASNGFISGTIQPISSNTTYNFTVTASDNANNQTSRAFSISVIATNYFGSGADGSGVFT